MGTDSTHGLVTFVESRVDVLPSIEAAAYHRWHLASGEDWITFHHDPDGYLLRFPGLAHFRISQDGRRVHCQALQYVPDSTLRQLLNQVLPIATNAQGFTVLHAGAVEVGESAIAFLGHTGVGKSTLTAALAGDGYRFLTDDVLRLRLSAGGRPVVTPGLPHLRLWDDSERVLAAGGTQEDATEKFRVPAGHRFPHCAQERPVTAIYLLGVGKSAAPTFEPALPAAAFLELLQNSFLIHPESQELLKVQHERLSAIARNVPVFRMTYARNYETLPEVSRATVAHARSLTPAA